MRCQAEVSEESAFNVVCLLARLQEIVHGSHGIDAGGFDDGHHERDLRFGTVSEPSTEAHDIWKVETYYIPLLLFFFLFLHTEMWRSVG